MICVASVNVNPEGLLSEDIKTTLILSSILNFCVFLQNQRSMKRRCKTLLDVQQ